MTKEALGELILSSERQLYATAKTILSDDQDCADAIQESIVKAFSKIDTLKKDRYAKTWLMRILINECYNIARRINVNEPLDEGYAENRKQPKENRDYSELYRAVNELKEELRIPVILYYMEELNIREIAQILEISEGAVQKRLVRARKTLKKKIQLEEIFI
nr:sigma-70 family RNA polymerase sigma factor [uncultured Mediterraneibacter sp.]